MADESTEAAVDGRVEPAPLPAMAANADDLAAMLSAVVDAASISAGLWLSYLFVLLYLLIAAGGVTHADLLFERAVKLPFLNVDLPLKGFFWLGPLLFLVVHTYVLLHFVLLAGKIRVFDAGLRAQIGDPDLRNRLRRQLPSNIFAQLLAGPPEVRRGITGFLLELIAWISLVIAPIALLVFFELQFLPYHSLWITWWQRIALIIDLLLLWTLWPRIVYREQLGEGRRVVRWGIALMFGCISLVLTFVVLTIAIVPGEWLDTELQNVRLIHAVRQTLVEGSTDFAVRKPKSLWSNVLVLPGLDVAGHGPDSTTARETPSFRARNLRGAVLIDATLRGVDFTAADLRDARLNGADLREAKFECSIHESVHVPGEQCAQLQGASLNQAQLQGAHLDGASLQGASFYRAQLQGAHLDLGLLQGARLGGAQLQGASLNRAWLQGADLDRAQLQGASFDRAQLQGAHLDGASLQGGRSSKAPTSLHAACANAEIPSDSTRTPAPCRQKVLRTKRETWLSGPLCRKPICTDVRAYLETLNPAQRRAVEQGVQEKHAAPGALLLVIAGAGSGKTNTLAHRITHLIVNGADPRRVLLMTCSRRAAAEMEMMCWT